jgi:hypothetical protein
MNSDCEFIIICLFKTGLLTNIVDLCCTETPRLLHLQLHALLHYYCMILFAYFCSFVQKLEPQSIQKFHFRTLLWYLIIAIFLLSVITFGKFHNSSLCLSRVLNASADFHSDCCDDEQSVDDRLPIPFYRKQ